MTDFLISKGWNYIGTTGGCTCSGGGKLRYTNSNYPGAEIRIKKSNQNFEIRKNNNTTNQGSGRTALETAYASAFTA